MGRFEIVQAAGAVVGGVLGTVTGLRFGTGTAVVGLFVGGVAGMLLATGVGVLLIWLWSRTG